MSVSIQTTPTFVVGKPESLFEDSYVTTIGPPSYDVTRDGQRFVMVKPAESERMRPPIHIVVDWFEELRRRVPTSR